MSIRKATSKTQVSAYFNHWQVVSILFVVMVAVMIWNSKDPTNTMQVEKQTQLKTQDFKADITLTKMITGHISVPPIVLWTGQSKGHFKSKLLCGNITCDYYHKSILIPPNTTGAYLFYASKIKINKWPLPRFPNKILWGLFHEESSRNLDLLLHEKGLKLFNYSSTFSRHSDVPFPLMHAQSLDKITSKQYFINTSVKNSLLTELAPILYLQSSCLTYTDRDSYVENLLRYQRIDSYGLCLNNKELPERLKRNYLQTLKSKELFAFIARYKFVIAIENSVCEDYITEKFWRAIHLGVVPIYFGSPSIRDWLPNEKSAILIEDFPTPKLLSQHIDLLMQDDDLYEEYLEHKTKGLIRNKNLVNEIKTRPYQSDFGLIEHEFQCFICKKLHELNESKSYRVINKHHYNCPGSKSALTLKTNRFNAGHQAYGLSKPIVEKIYRDIKKNC